MSAIPPLLMLIEGRRPRVRGVPVARPKELELHFAVAALLRKHGAAGWNWTHFPAGELRDPRLGAKLKLMGLRAGWSDFLLAAPNGARLHALELKRRGEDLSEDQQIFRNWCDGVGAPFVVARTLDEATAALSAWGAIDLWRRS